jgi:DASS family divalent anion:Na+ symporter
MIPRPDSGSSGGWPALAATALFALAVWFWPPPEGLTLQAWRLFAVFASAIFAVVTGALPLLTASVVSIAAAVLTGALPPAKAYAGFASGTILLIVVAYLVARAVLTSGLGARIGHRVVSRFGRTALGLSYSIFIVDGIIAPAFPSNTARAGVLYPLALSLADAVGADTDQERRRRVGGFLMFSGIASLSLSSALWLTAMAANPLGAEMARAFGVDVTFTSWFVAASVPTLVAMALLPLLLHRLMAPGGATPDAPAASRRALAAMGPMSREERIVAAVFVAMVLLWSLSGPLGVDLTAVAFLGLGVLLVTGVLTPRGFEGQGGVLATFIWFAVLFTLSSQLNELGFMAHLGRRMAGAMVELPPALAGPLLVTVYVLLHYLFVSQTAHLLALFPVFMQVGVNLEVPAAPLAFLLLFATNFFSAISPQASSANPLFIESGFLSQSEVYRLGAVTTAFNLAVYLALGMPWLLAVTR